VAVNVRLGKEEEEALCREGDGKDDNGYRGRGGRGGGKYYSFQFNWYFPTLGISRRPRDISLAGSREISQYSPLYYSYRRALQKLGKNFAHNDY
jgi:hypothetical protein